MNDVSHFAPHVVSRSLHDSLMAVQAIAALDGGTTGTVIYNADMVGRA